MAWPRLTMRGASSAPGAELVDDRARANGSLRYRFTLADQLGLALLRHWKP